MVMSPQFLESEEEELYRICSDDSKVLFEQGAWATEYPKLEAELLSLHCTVSPMPKYCPCL